MTPIDFSETSEIKTSDKFKTEMFVSIIETLHFENVLFETDKSELRHSIATIEMFVKVVLNIKASDNSNFKPLSTFER
jgi:tRNA threonylcarbamoyladenosine modification (KEOPS) complex  Pcc1 subunit